MDCKIISIKRLCEVEKESLHKVYLNCLPKSDFEECLAQVLPFQIDYGAYTASRFRRVKLFAVFQPTKCRFPEIATVITEELRKHIFRDLIMYQN